MSRRGKNEGSIFQRKDGLWVSQMQLGRTVSGKRKYITYYGKTRREVAQKLENSLADVNKNMFVASNKLTYNEWIWKFMRDFKKRTVSASTYARYVALINIYVIDEIRKYANSGHPKWRHSKNI